MLSKEQDPHGSQDSAPATLSKEPRTKVCWEMKRNPQWDTKQCSRKNKDASMVPFGPNVVVFSCWSPLLCII